MFLRFTLHTAHALHVCDEPLDPFNRESEIYQTWQLTDLEDLEPGPNTKVKAARQGFSAGGAPDDGVSFDNGDRRVLDDPAITFVLPDLQDGESRYYRLDIHWWESDTSSETVRAAFTDSTLQILIKALQAAGQNQAAASRAIEDWIHNNGEDVVKAALAAASITMNSWINVGFQLLPLLGLVVDAVKSNSDDYIGMHRFVLELGKDAGELKWRVSSPSQPNAAFLPVERFQRMYERMTDADGPGRGNDFEAEYVCYVLT